MLLHTPGGFRELFKVGAGLTVTVTSFVFVHPLALSVKRYTAFLGVSVRLTRVSLIFPVPDEAGF